MWQTWKSSWTFSSSTLTKLYRLGGDTVPLNDTNNDKDEEAAIENCLDVPIVSADQRTDSKSEMSNQLLLQKSTQDKNKESLPQLK